MVRSYLTQQRAKTWFDQRWWPGMSGWRSAISLDRGDGNCQSLRVELDRPIDPLCLSTPTQVVLSPCSKGCDVAYEAIRLWYYKLAKPLTK